MKGRSKPKPSYLTEMDERTWANASLIERAVHVARSQERLDVQEFPRGSNWGPMVSVYLRTAGLNKPAAWCAAFVFWCLIEAGADRKKLWKFPASTWFLKDWAEKTKRAYDDGAGGPINGSWRFLGMFHNGGNKGGHVWFNLNHRYDTLEGNTNAGGSREGYEVAQRNRTPKSMAQFKFACFIRIDDDLFAQ